MDLMNQFLAPYSSLFSAATSSELPESSIISINFSEMGLILINVAILILILSLILYKPVLKFMNKRKEGIRKNLEDADALRKEAEDLKAEYELQLHDIEKERDQILMNANTMAMQRSEEIIKEAREEAELFHRHAIGEIEEERAAMQEEVKRQLIELSLSIAERYVTVSMDQETQGKYVDEAIASWEENRWQD